MMATEGPLGDKDWLSGAYVAEGRSSMSIAAEVGCAPQTVINALLRHGLAVRPPTLRHGHSVRVPGLGVTSITYTSWQNMLQRCRDTSNDYYTDITVCDRWDNRKGGGFHHFLADMGERPSAGHSLGRVNNDGNYQPENCRWETAKQQANNRRPRRK